jgi:uncharacterized protein YgiM (DUF1202 family)
MKTKTLIMVTLIAFTLGCGTVQKLSTGVKEKFGKKEEPVRVEAQQEQLARPEPIKEGTGYESTQKAAKLTPKAAVPPRNMVSVTGSVVNIRSGPGTANKVIAKVRRGDGLEVRGETLSWYNVKLSNGVKGWIYKKLVK